MASFITLPVEIQQIILEECDWPTFRSLSLLSKAVRTVAIPFLYRELHWGPGGHITEWSCTTVQLLLRTLIDCPELASLVQRVHFYVEYEYNFLEQDAYLEDWEAFESDPEITALGRKLVATLDLEHPSSWHSSLRWTYLDNWIALLLSQLTSTETLRMAPPLLHKANKLGEILVKLIRPGSAYFHRLRHIGFGEKGRGFEVRGLQISNDMVRSFFYLPSLQELDLTMYHPAIKDCGISEPSTSLETLRLWRLTILNPEDMDNLLRLAPRLKTLHLGLNKDIDVYSHRDRIKFSDLPLALARVSNTLEDLTIDFGVDSFGIRSSSLGDVPLGSLRKFECLKRLEIPFEMLVGYAPWKRDALTDVLPRNLETLILQDGSVTWKGWGDPPDVEYDEPIFDYSLQDMIDTLDEFLQVCSQHTPRLASMILNFANGPLFTHRDLINTWDPSRNHPQVQQLRDMALKTNVALTVLFDEETASRETETKTLVVYDRTHPESPPHHIKI
ncbi:hypothetical protein BJY04DRAFT_107511 [Aspergillus karnatakaensis]|uniref:uncharacterized protein n=1 Tax=Aspergillus karnatakaensis TaxID=1810916 RepID=UPI003CCDAE93